MNHERLNVLRALTQRRHDDWQDIQAIVKVLSEPTRSALFLKVPVRRSHNSNIHVYLPRRAYWVDHPFLQYPQHLGLQFQRHIAYFIEKNRTFMGKFKSPHPVRDGSGKSSLSMTKKLAFKQVPRDGGTVEWHKRIAPPL